MGRPPHQPNGVTLRQVEAMAAYGIPEKDIARVVGVDPKTLRKHYREELDTGSIKATAKVAEFLFRKATTEGPQCVTAAIFWMKTRGGWREAPQSHHLSVSRIEEMSDEELIARLADIEILMGRTEPRPEPKLIELEAESD